MEPIGIHQMNDH